MDLTISPCKHTHSIVHMQQFGKEAHTKVWKLIFLLCIQRCYITSSHPRMLATIAPSNLVLIILFPLVPSLPFTIRLAKCNSQRTHLCLLPAPLFTSSSSSSSKALVCVCFCYFSLSELRGIKKQPAVKCVMAKVPKRAAHTSGLSSSSTSSALTLTDVITG
jgi:hypothetical protein